MAKKEKILPSGQVIQLPGHKTLLTPELTKQLVTRLRKGVSRIGACDSVGLSMGTFKDWLNKGADEVRHPECAAFRTAIRAAEYECEHRWLNLAVKHADENGDAKTIVDILSRRFSKRWAKKDNMHVELTGKNNGPITITAEDARQQLSQQLDSVMANLEEAEVVGQLEESNPVPEQLGVLGETESASSEGE